MLTHLGLSAWVSPVNLTLGRVIHQALAFLGIRLLLEAQYNTACTELSGLPRELRWERGSAKIRRHMTGPLHDLELKTKLENHIPQLTWNSREENETNSHQCFKSLNFAVLSVNFQDSRSCSEEDSDSGKAKEMLAPNVHQPQLQATHLKQKCLRWFAHDPKCQSPALASLQSSRCVYSAGHSTAPLRWLIDNSNSLDHRGTP